MSTENFAGRTIAGYELNELVGEGGTATVYRAKHADHGPCAVKFLKQRLRKDPTSVKRFLREAGFGARVEHTSVVSTYDYGQEDDLYYLALEWVTGEPLSTFAQRSGPLAPSLVVHIVSQLTDGLAAAHAVGIIHRDLKPENVVFDPTSQIVKLLDFGIARDAQEPASDRLTRTGFFVGTLQYVAPEALSGELVGEQADIFSVAKITYYLLTGVLPHPGRSPREVFQQLLTQPPTPLNQAVRDLKFPTELEDAVMRGLERQPADRQPTVVAFAEELADGVEASNTPPKKGLFGSIKSFVKDRRTKD
jgi:serine/threonine-protein kinase